MIQLRKDTPAVLFSAETGGVSGWQIHFALLRPGTGKDLEDLFASDTSVTNQSQHAFLNDSAISDAPIFMTADYAPGPNEGHHGEHRYIISAYFFVGGLYYPKDRYMTVHKYDVDANEDVLGSERQEMLARLKRVKTETNVGDNRLARGFSQ